MKRIRGGTTATTTGRWWRERCPDTFTVGARKRGGRRNWFRRTRAFVFLRGLTLIHGNCYVLLRTKFRRSLLS